MRTQELMIWTPDGVWLQTGHDEGGVRLSHCGVIPLDEVKHFCARTWTWLEVRVPGQPARWFGPDGDEREHVCHVPLKQRNISRRLTQVT